MSYWDVGYWQVQARVDIGFAGCGDVFPGRFGVTMFKRITNSWNLAYVFTLGLALLMISTRAELQPRPGHEHAPAAKVALAGHILTWTPAAIAAYRIAHGLLKRNKSERPADDAQVATARELVPPPTPDEE
ncbi:hypothetical protein, partial [Enhygromyxa salina]|uniref:hypothetical protein n=1 Tax=Enhygromyxa salina TaxID=215803 RepID=UPI0011B23A21